LQHLIATYGILAVFVLMLAESACIPIPSEVVMLFGGAMAAGGVAGGSHPSLIGVIIAGAAGNVVGSYIAWWAGRRWGQAAVRGFGRKLHIHDRDIDKATDWFGRYGPAAVLIGRVVPVIRTFISLPAGFADMPAVKFGVYTTLGCVPWTTGLGIAGYQLGSHWDKVAHALHSVSYVVIAIVVIILAAAVIVRRRHRGQETEDDYPPYPYPPQHQYPQHQYQGHQHAQHRHPQRQHQPRHSAPPQPPYPARPVYPGQHERAHPSRRNPVEQSWGRVPEQPPSRPPAPARPPASRPYQPLPYEDYQEQDDSWPPEHRQGRW